MQDIKKCIDILISLQTTNGNFPCAMDELGSRKRPEKDELVHWCHGAPGSQIYFGIIIIKKKRNNSYCELCIDNNKNQILILLNEHFFFRCCIFIS